MHARLGDRSLFPDLEARAYLNHAAISPPSRLVADRVREVVASYARQGLAAFPAWIDQRNRLREKLASLVGASSRDIGFVANTTTGVIDIAWCLPWQRGDRVLCFEGEFPTNVTPWQRAAAHFDLQLDLLPLDGFGDGSGRGLQRVEEELKRGARLIAVSAVQFQTGLRMPLRELSALAHHHGAELFVDGIQAVGIVPLDVRALGIDYLSCGSHKWLMAPEGCAFVYVSPERVRQLVPRLAGWLSHEDGLRFLFEGAGHLSYDRPIRDRADFLEVGAPNTIGLAALEVAVDTLTELGLPAIFEHVQRYHDALEPLLVDRGFRSLRADAASRSGILSVRPPEGVFDGDVVHALGERGVSVANPDGHVRFSPHWPNALDEVPGVADALDRVLATRG